MGKSFLVLFFKKEPLASLTLERPNPATHIKANTSQRAA
jgi:hypothetical protein